MKKVVLTDEECIMLQALLYREYKNDDNTKYSSEKLLGILRKVSGESYNPMVCQLTLSDLKYFIKRKDNTNFNVLMSIFSLVTAYLLGSEDAGITRINYRREKEKI